MLLLPLDRLSFPGILKARSCPLLAMTISSSWSTTAGVASCSDMEEDGDGPFWGLLLRRESSSSELRSSSDWIVGRGAVAEAGRPAFGRGPESDEARVDFVWACDPSPFGTAPGPVAEASSLERELFWSTVADIADVFEHSALCLAEMLQDANAQMAR